MTNDSHYKLLKLLEQNPQATQRELATALGVSLGKVNYCLKALIGKCHVKEPGVRSEPGVMNLGSGLEFRLLGAKL